MFVLFEIENKNKNMSHVQTEKKMKNSKGNRAWLRARAGELRAEERREKKKREKEITQEMLVVKLKYSSQHLVNFFFFLKTKSIFPF